MTDGPFNIARKRWAAPAGLLFGAVLAAVLVVGYAWQSSLADSRLTDAVSHAETAVYLQETVKEATIATDLLEEFVLTGDEALVPQIQNQSTTVSLLLSGAVSGGGENMGLIAVQGTRLAEGAGAVVALRQAGELGAAEAVLTDLRAQLDAFAVTIQTPIGAELDAAVSLTNSSDNADVAAAWLLATGIAVAIATGAGFLLFAGRSLLKPPTAPPLHRETA